ncbi:uncharacterized protein LOC6546695 [Drosophila erecta]|uniref:Uncharacterized protein n=1 Tax=Drosophila erecta TaxID=7220 RepID=B3NLJ5_DROER|nr:uncharacterized protein LOC6546695 [Drosophila erecta]EDV54911.2 uncharacterized protein Dere_GG21054 [Drosophila erecta]
MNSIVIFILPLFVGLGIGLGAPFSNEIPGKMAEPNKTVNVKTEEFQLQSFGSLGLQKIPQYLINLIRNVDSEIPGERNQNLSLRNVGALRKRLYTQNAAGSPKMGYLDLMVFLIDHICRFMGLIS